MPFNVNISVESLIPKVLGGSGASGILQVDLKMDLRVGLCSMDIYYEGSRTTHHPRQSNHYLVYLVVPKGLGIA